MLKASSISLVLALTCVSIAQKEERALRKLYDLRDRCYMRKDAVKLWSTQQPNMHAITFDGKKVETQKIKDHISWRLKNQVKGERYEKPIKFKIAGSRAEVQVVTYDDFTVADANNVRTRNVRREHCLHTWRKTTKGWKLEQVKFTKVQWVDEKGKWQTRP